MKRKIIEGETRKRTQEHEKLDLFHRSLRSSNGEKDTPYLGLPVVIKEDILLDDTGYVVMMPWERPFMDTHTNYITRHTRKLLVY